MNSYLIFTSMLIVLLAILLLGLLLSLLYLLLSASRDNMQQGGILLPPSSKEEHAKWRAQKNEVAALHMAGAWVEREKRRQQKAFAWHSRLDGRFIRGLRLLKNAVWSLAPRTSRHKRLMNRATSCRDKIRFLTQQYWQNPQEHAELLPVINWRCQQMTDTIEQIKALVPQSLRQLSPSDPLVSDQREAQSFIQTEMASNAAPQEKDKEHEERMRLAEAEINPICQLENEEQRLYEEQLAAARLHRNELRFLTRQYLQRPQERASLLPVIRLHRQQLAAAIKQADLLRLLEKL